MNFWLPFPPSVNTPYSISRGKRTKGGKVLAWEKIASEAANKQNVIIFPHRAIVIYKLHHPDGRIRDAANYEKITTDFLVAEGILRGDERRHIKGIFSYWSDLEGNRVEVTLLDANRFTLQQADLT